MPRVLYLKAARDDLLDIWRYVVRESHDRKLADRLIRSINKTCKTYASQPQLGELRPDLADRVRCFPVGRYVVFYVPLDDGIEVLQVTDGTRDLPAHFRVPQ